MAGFTLGGSSGDQEEDPNLYIYSSNNSGNPRGFELWQQHQQISRQPRQFYSSAPTMLGFSDMNQHNLAGSGSGLAVHRRGSSSGSGGMSCQDCGNQAKKDCAYMRCRTCCKSRGFQCPTHVKSTWVPVATWRERQQQLAAGIAVGRQQQHHHQQQSQMHQRRELPKRPREITTILPLVTTSSGMEVRYPSEINSTAVFRCVRVSQMEEGEEEYAYQTAVNVGGHLFRGILYDQGPEQVHVGSSSAAAITGSSRNAAGSGEDRGNSVYPTSLNAFIDGTQFFSHHHPRS